MNKTFLFAIVILVMHACKQPGEQVRTADATVSVAYIHPRYVEMTEPVRTTGVLATRMEVKLSFKTGGIIQTLAVSEGLEVKEGALLAALDLSEIKAQATQADIALDKAHRDFRRANNLYFDSVVTLETLQNARTAYELAQSQKKIADFNLEHSRIIAPANGVIQKVLVEKNEMIAPGHPAILFATTENDWISRVSLADKDIVKFDIGDSARVFLDAFPADSFAAKVLELGTIADPVTGTFEVELLLKDSRPQFRTGFIARVMIYPSELTAGYWLPMEALQDLESGSGKVYILEDSVASARWITTGAVYKDGMIISSGIDGSEKVITEGSSYVKDGQTVQLHKEDESR